MNKEKLKQNIAKAFNRIVKDKTKKCVVCNKPISEDEFKNGAGACYKCWEK